MVEGTSAPQAQSHTSRQAARQLEDAERFLQSGQFAEAQNACREVLSQHPEYVAALVTLGRAYLAAQQYEAALPPVLRASMLCPDEPSILLCLARIYFHLDAGELARLTAERVSGLTPDEETAGGTCFLLGRIHRGQADYGQALEYLARVPPDARDFHDAMLLLGSCHMARGDSAEARSVYEKVLKGNAASLDRAQILHDLSAGADSKTAKKILSDIEALSSELPRFESDEQGARFAARLDFARATALANAGRHEEAWEALEAANAPFHRVYAQGYSHIRESDAYTIERASGWMFTGPLSGTFGDDVPVSLLVLGPARSGKTTLERLVGALPDVTRGYDHGLVHAAALQTSQSNGFLPLAYPGQLPTVLHEQFSRNYAREAVRRARGAKVLTCTHQGLIADLGRIVETVPDVKVIFLERDRDDAALGIFSKLYPEDVNPFAYNVPGIYEHLDSHARLAQAWSETLGDLAMRLSYEDMIAGPKAALEQIAEFCGLAVPKGALPELADGRGSAAPYLGKLKAGPEPALGESEIGRWASPDERR